MRTSFLILRSTATLGLSLALMAGKPSQAQSIDFDENILSSLIISQEVLTHSLRQGTAREGYIASTLSPLRGLDRDRDGLDKEDLAREYARRATNRRKYEINQLLGYDYNGDYTVTRAEIIEFSRHIDAAQREAEAEGQMARFDRDGDGVATLDEVTQIDPEDEEQERDQFENGLLALDPNNDGQLTASELSEIAQRVFDHFDQNNNGLIDEDEHIRLTQYTNEKRIRQRLIEQGCRYPFASVNSELVIFATEQSAVLADTWVGAPSVETSIADVVIEPGDTSLYLVLSSYHSTIWRFSGATERVEQIIASSYVSPERTSGVSHEQDWPLASAVAVIGIDGERFQDLPAGCLTNGANIDDEHRGSADRIARLVGKRAMDVIVSQYNVGSVTLPKGEARRVMPSEIQSPDGFEPQMWRDALRFKPGGLEKVDPASLVTSQPVGVYEVLPYQFGLSQLLASGVLERSEDRNDRRLIITDEMPHWPAGLHGSHRADFVVRVGVQIPDGHPGHSCVMTETQAAERLWSQECRVRLFNQSNETDASQPRRTPIRQELHDEAGVIIVTSG